MRRILKKIIFIFFCLYSLFFLIVSSAAPILAHFKIYEASAFMTSFLLGACHQQPDRSFWFLGYPVALCCRCYGFYLGVVFSSFAALTLKYKTSLRAFITLSLLVGLDIILNFGLKINTGNILRFVTGLFIGIIFISALCYIIDLKKVKGKL